MVSIKNRYRQVSRTEMDFQPNIQTHRGFRHYSLNCTQQNTRSAIRKKSESLPLYPLHSIHSPGIRTGLVIGNCHQIHTPLSYAHPMSYIEHKTSFLVPIFIAHTHVHMDHFIRIAIYVCI